MHVSLNRVNIRFIKSSQSRLLTASRGVVLNRVRRLAEIWDCVMEEERERERKKLGKRMKEIQKNNTNNFKSKKERK